MQSSYNNNGMLSYMRLALDALAAPPRSLKTKGGTRLALCSRLPWRGSLYTFSEMVSPIRYDGGSFKEALDIPLRVLAFMVI